MIKQEASGLRSIIWGDPPWELLYSTNYQVVWIGQGTSIRPNAFFGGIQWIVMPRPQSQRIPCTPERWQELWDHPDECIPGFLLELML